MRPDILGYEKGDTGIVHLRIRGLARATPSSCTFQWKRDSSQKKNPKKQTPKSQTNKMPKQTNKNTKTINQPKKKKGKGVFSESKRFAPRRNQFYQTNLRGSSSKQVEKLKLLAFFLQVSLKVTSRNPSFLAPSSS